LYEVGYVFEFNFGSIAQKHDFHTPGIFLQNFHHHCYSYAEKVEKYVPNMKYITELWRHWILFFFAIYFQTEEIRVFRRMRICIEVGFDPSGETFRFTTAHTNERKGKRNTYRFTLPKKVIKAYSNIQKKAVQLFDGRVDIFIAFHKCQNKRQVLQTENNVAH
jgi:hypothetical protein